MKAFIGEPADAQGNALVCSRCDRRARALVDGEPRCSWHEFPRLPASVLHGVAERRRDLKRREGGNG